MISEDLRGRLRGASPVRLTSDDLAEIIETAEVVRCEHTGMAGMLRVLDLGGRFFVQEETQDEQILVRPRPGVDEAQAFVDRRLLAYERMWDG